MIVCSCNVIREREIRAAARRGCPDAETAYRSMGCQFDCCQDHADDLVADERAKLLAPRDIRAA